jgi:hypothetical protein
MAMNTGLLIVGQVIKLSGPELFRVATVNECRARIVPIDRKPVTIKDKTFYPTAGGVDISPYSYVELIEEPAQLTGEIKFAVHEGKLGRMSADKPNISSPPSNSKIKAGKPVKKPKPKRKPKK